MKRVFTAWASNTGIRNAKDDPAGGGRCPYRNSAFMAILLLLPVFGLDAENFETYVAVSVQPHTNWLYLSGEHLDYTIKPSPFTSLEFSLEYKKFLKLFFDVDINVNDNFVGEIIDSKAFAKIAGMLGVKNFTVRAAWGQMEGEAVWEGPPIPGQPRTAAVSTKYTEVALLYNWSLLFLGLMYQNYHIPIGVAGFAYDDDMVFNYYGAYFGTRTYNSFMEEHRGAKKPAFGLWLDSALSYGVAIGDISEEAKRRMKWGEVIAEDMMQGGGSGAISGDSPVGFGMNGQIIAGICGAVNVGKLTLGFGAGYDGFVQLYGHLNYLASLIRHGAAVKVSCSF
jgi:hypothetical protein